MKTGRFLLALASLAFLYCGCDEGSGTSHVQMNCTANDAAKCDADNAHILVCKDGKWQEDASCEYGCDAGKCKTLIDHDSCPNDCQMDGGRTQKCVTIGGTKMCKNACLKSNKGENIACYQNGSIGPEAPIYSIVETCTEDDNGELFSSNEKSEQCAEACDETTGKCSEPATPETCPNDCQIDGGRTQKCVTIGGSKMCKNACLVSQKGENVACYQNGSIGPEAPIYSIVETCVEDDNGLLYASKEESTQCDNGCNEESGQCSQEPAPEECPNNCMNIGGRAQTCVTIDGSKSCKNTCLAYNKGDNKVCYQSASLGPNAPSYSIDETCVEDDNGLLYASKEEAVECDNDCDDESGECVEEVIKPDGCPNDCIKDGGRAQKCVTVFGAKTCRNTCLGTKEGSHLSCYINNSLGPDAPAYSISETCAMDDNGILYSTNEKTTQCDNGCDDESGKCINEVIIPGECPNNCANDGGHAQTCVIIDGVKSCQNTCLGTETGQHSSCYRNASLGPDAPVFSVSETCALDDNGQLYSTNETSTKCDFSCNEASGECEANCELPCEAYIGSRPYACILTEGKASCRQTCASDHEGENRSCVKVGNPSSPFLSVVEVCKYDNFNTLYSAEIKSTKTCPNGCDETTGNCISCSKECWKIIGGRRKVCALVNNVEECMDECLGLSEGENTSCRRMSTSPSAPMTSVKEICKYDVNGTLYSDIVSSTTTCNNGCNENTGKCK